MMKTTPLLCALMLAAFCSLRAAPMVPAASPIDKSNFHFFDPTPVEAMRPMNVDGPGRTDSPYTVDAGHFQIEMLLVGYSSYEEVFEGVHYRYDWWSIGPIALKAGLFNNLDLHLIFEPYNHSYEREHGFYAETRSGIGDTTLRLKFNCWGNDRGFTALALMPYYRFATSEEGLGNSSDEAGLIMPLAIQLPAKFHLGFSTGVAKARSDTEIDYHTEYRNSVSLGRELFWESLEGYVEFFSEVSTEKDVGWAGTFNGGLVYWINEDLQLNAGVEVGLTEWADDLFGFLGMGWRY